MHLFAPDFRYEDRAAESIQEATKRFRNIEDIVLAIEWALIHDPNIGPLLNERGVRGFVFPGARSIREPDVDVLYEVFDDHFVIQDLTFREAKAQYAGNA